MRILMISDVYFPRVNGVSTSIQTFAREFVDKGHQVTLIAPDYASAPEARATRRRCDSRPPQACPSPRRNLGGEMSPHSFAPEDAETFEIIRIPSRYLPLDPEDRILRTGRLKAHRKRLTQRDYDLLHIQTPFIAHYAGLGLARRLRIPVVESYHTFFEQYLDKYVPFVPAAWLRFAARRFSAGQCNDMDALVVPSRAMLRVLQSYGVGTLAAVIPTGIELEQFSGGEGPRFRRRHGIPPERPVLVHVGRLAFEKNIEFLLHMLTRVKRSVPEVLLVIAGEGPARRGLETLTKRLGLRDNLLFVGYLERDGALEDCYCAGDAFVFASRTETQGLVLLEAMALGVPVVSTAIMGTQEVLDGGHGCLIAEDDEADFAAKAVRLLTEPDLRGRLSGEARHYAEGWSAPALADHMLDFYAEVVTLAGACAKGGLAPVRARTPED
ncbi:MAG: glycosyltransferase [Pseudomonadota bacterium]|nr:glycosyltransferase [Pseudomonadota bacterium]